jgi:hypothetical protein
MKQKHRYRRKRKGAGLIEQWPENVTAAELAARVTYVGSSEHKARPLLARLINRTLGQYKGWPIGQEELPTGWGGQPGGAGEESGDAGV